jgi:hypothetical protein
MIYTAEPSCGNYQVIILTLGGVMSVSNERPPTGYMGNPATNKRMGLVRFATDAEAAAGTSNNTAVSPDQLSTFVDASFASPPVLGFGSTTPRPVHATTLDSTGLTSLATGAGAVTNIGNATGTVGFFGVTAAARPGATTEIKAGLSLMGLLTDGGATPLNLDGGAMTSGALTSTGNTALATTAASTAALGNSSGTVGFFGSAGATRVTQGAITNSVTAGGVTGTIADYTDLTVYANDAAAIRNDIYQLSLALANVTAALRSYGLLA